MTPLRRRLLRAVAMALIVLALTASVAAADGGGSTLYAVPFDPGLLGGQADPSPY